MKVIRAASVAIRSLIILGAMLIIGMIMLGAKGSPRSSRSVQRDEVSRFAARPLAGIAQLGGELLLMAGLTWACRGPLRIRL